MKVCGIELKGSNAIFTCLEGDGVDHHFIAENTRKIGLDDSKVQQDIKDFSSAINSFFEEMKFDRIAIKARAEKGRFAGGAVSFKMEGLIQNCDFPVEVVHVASIKSKLKGVEIDLTSVKKYQEESLKLATYLLQ